MNLSSNKSDIYNKIKLYTSIANSNINNNESIQDILSNNDNPLDFIFDLVNITVGENGLEILTQVVLSKVITQSYLNRLSDKIYDFVGNNLPTKSQINSTTIDLPLNVIDPTNTLKKADSESENGFSNAIKTQVLQNPNATATFNLGTTNKQINLKYDETTNSIKTGLPNLSMLELFTGLRASIGPMFSANVVINEILNILFHNDFTQEDAQVLTMVRSYTQFQTKDVFKMDLKKLLDIELDTAEKGFNINVSCFRENITITKEQIDGIISNPTVENFKTLIPEFVTETTTTTPQVENENAKKDYFKKIMQAILDSILSIIIKQPVIMFFITMYHKVLDFSIELTNVRIPELFDKFKIFLENLFDDIFEEIFCIFLNWIKKYLIKLVVGVTIILLKEQLQKRKDILLSLSGSKFLTKLKEIKSIGQQKNHKIIR